METIVAIYSNPVHCGGRLVNYTVCLADGSVRYAYTVPANPHTDAVVFRWEDGLPGLAWDEFAPLARTLPAPTWFRWEGIDERRTAIRRSSQSFQRRMERAKLRGTTEFCALLAETEVRATVTTRSYICPDWPLLARLVAAGVDA